ncbi:MAG: SdrD B-like domain-containing protein, partial [Bacteroidota bacterium]
NFRNDTAVDNLTEGQLIADLQGNCFDLSAPIVFTVCDDIEKCEQCLGQTASVDLGLSDPSPNQTRQFLLLSTSGSILAIADSPDFPDLEEGLYSVVAATYTTGGPIDGIEVGRNIINVSGADVTISAAIIFGLCQQLNPDIVFSLNDCNITQQAVLAVSQAFDSYRWSTGETSRFIRVPATTAATYRVTVMLADGCIGIVDQRVGGDEVSVLGDYVWEDSNFNGRQDRNESGINGVTVNLYTDFNRDGLPDIASRPSCTTVTGNNPDTGEPGFYTFNVYQAFYLIEFIAPQGFDATEQNQGDDQGDSDIRANGFTNTITIGRGQINNSIDAGFRTSTGVGGSIWEDEDADGRRDLSEVGLDGVTINIYDGSGNLVATEITDADPDGEANGLYCFEELPVQPYYVEIVLPDGSVVSDPNIGSNDLLDSEFTGANGPSTTDLIVTQPGVKTEGIDGGIYFGGTVCGLVWRDAIMSDIIGVFEPGVDTIVPNSEVYLLDVESGDTVLTAVTGDDGRYCLNAVPVGSYRLGFGATPAASSFVPQGEGDDPLLDSDVNTSSNTTEVIFVGSRDTILGINAGLRMGVVPVTLTDFSGFWDQKFDVNRLEWSTASEINNDRFVVERLTGSGQVFEVIGEVSGAGNSSEVVYYEYQDNNIKESGTYYYRLRQIDYDGGHEYSPIIAINVYRNKTAVPSTRTIEAGEVLIFPNPVQDEFQILLETTIEQTVQVLLTDLRGRLVREWSPTEIQPGANVLSYQVPDILTGTYLLTISDGVSTKNQKILISSN